MQPGKIRSHIILLLALTGWFAPADTLAANAPSGKNWTMTVTISGNTTLCQNTALGLTAAVSNGAGTLTYQWKRNGVNVSSNIGSPPANILVYSGEANGEVYTCVVTSTTSGTATSNALTVTVNTPQPFSVTATR